MMLNFNIEQFIAPDTIRRFAFLVPVAIYGFVWGVLLPVVRKYNLRGDGWTKDSAPSLWRPDRECVEVELNAVIEETDKGRDCDGWAEFEYTASNLPK
jgi:hypothetical protein